jgi:PAS domain S-box-containing protein
MESVHNSSKTNFKKPSYAELEFRISQLEKAKEALKESEERYRTIFINSPVGIFRSTFEGRFIEVNTALAHMLGYESPEDVLKSIHSIKDQIYVDSEKRPEIVSDQLKSHDVYRHLNRYCRKDGTEFIANLYLKTVRDEKGEPVHLEGIVEDITDRKHAEDALRQSESFYRQTLESIPGMVFTTRPNGYNDYASKQWASYTGVAMKEHLGFGWKKVLHPDDRIRVGSAWQTALEGKAKYDLEYRIKRHDGVFEWFRVVCKPILDENGRIVRWFGVTISIQDRKKIEEDLEQSRSRMAWVLKQVGVGTWLNELPFGRLDWDEQTKALFFVPPDAVATIDLFWSRLHPEDHEPTRIAVEKALSEQTQYTMEHRVVNPDTGEIRWIRSIGQATYAEDGTPVRFDGINYDITTHKQSEEALRMSEERYRRLVETANEGIWVIDHDGRTVFVNSKMAEMLGCTVNEMVNTSLHDFVDPEEKPLAHEYMERRQQGTTEQHDIRFRRKDGNIFWASVSTNPIVDDRGVYLGALGMVTDITARKQSEEALLQLNRTLDQRVAERTALAESRAKQLQALAVELIEAEERERQRVADLLHDDLQQMLAAAKYTLGTDLEQSPQLSEVQHLLEKTILKTRHLSHQLSPAVLHQSGLTAAIDWLCRNLQDQFGIEIRCDMPGSMKIESEPLKFFLFRASQELLFNIAKHAGVKTGKLVLSSSDDHIDLVIADSGKGFDTSILESHTSREGLGLRMLKERASYVGGRLTVESGVGQGTRVCLKVPAIKSVKTPQLVTAFTDEEKIQLPPEPDKLSVGVIRVLFADDHKVLRQGLIRLVSGKPNIAVVGEAANGREALTLARQLAPDVIVMDVSMPGMDGIEATRRIKSELPEIRIIGLSMHEDKHVSRTMREAGAESFISKAASSEELLHAIYEIKKV